MLKKKIVAIVLSLVLLLTFFAFTASARGRVDVDAIGSLTLHYRYEDQVFSDLDVRIFRVAEISPNVEFTLTGAFADYQVAVTNLKTQDEWNQAAATLAAYVVSDGIAADQTAVTGGEGSVTFSDLKTGLYLVEGVRAEYDKGYCDFASFLISVPNVDAEDNWMYDVEANPKSVYVEAVPEDITYTVNKLWKDAGNENKRPQNVELALYKDGEFVEAVVLSSENNWTYSWIAPDDGSVWHAVEPNVPNGYTVTLEQRGNYFYVINTYDGPPDIPGTGDTSNIFLFVGLMGLSGIILVILGIGAVRGKKK